ncbi:NAD(P)/FAD-dependent oxidoreductase [Actinomadura parmotrematis]|uniref:NAD(P)/FAD-dependent oxidoreductase n=1 Tax=Actinomadura parmotrematis TaxID=2864039 RepID=A0ABS7G0X3_9ACTN|nr:NAD(P)/FAD-dependent oxidoreductase [Actinomadura parmotrematis]MBW8485487.1 NAD(P)/FAD-dependent oxidoreductase [Actinomadura parmotrematis]
MLDVLIAGAGPAGLATAVHAAERGLTALVVEPRPAPIDKACGEGLMPAGLAALHALGVDPPGHPLRGIRYLDAAGPPATARFAEPGRGVRRTALHEALWARAAELGVPVVQGRVTGVVQRAGHVEAAGHRARWLVAADGLHSPLRAALGLDAPVPPPRRYGLRRHFRTPPWTDLVEVHWAGDAEAYVTPVGPDLVGVALLSGARRPYADHLAAFPELRARLAGPAASRVRGAGPLRRRARRRVAGRVLLVGDAAGYVDALTGEGVSLAVRAAGELVRCLAADRPGDYEAAWRSLTRRHRLLTGALLGARRRPATARLIVPLARRLPLAFGTAVRALA